MNRRPAGSLPSSKTLTRKAQDLGKAFWETYKDKRREYRMKGLTPREAVERAARELQLLERWDDWKVRAEFAKRVGQDVAATNEEVRQHYPNYRSPLEVTADSVGDAELSFAEEVLWARDQQALVKGGGPPPVHFPSKGALGWYQYSLSNHDKFMTHVANVSKPNQSGDDAYMKDGEYRFKEIEGQLVEALREVGEKMTEYESGFVDQLKEALLVT